MARCQALGMAAENDAACQAAWAENRRRFFSDSPSPEPR
jgi:conjugative transfer region protein TrbK